MENPIAPPHLPAGMPLAVLVSGGLDSAVLIQEVLRSQPAIFPLFVRSGLYWEPAELSHLRRFLEAVQAPSLRPLAILELPVRDLYGEHWSVTGRGVPDADSADAAVFLPGRNVLLLAKAILWCHLHEVGALALGLLGGNPFPDATPAFFDAYESVVNRAVGSQVRLYRPYASLSKAALLRRSAGLPLELTFSCIRPVDGLHCGRCNKCAERRRAFAAAGIEDRTEYREEESCIG